MFKEKLEGVQLTKEDKKWLMMKHTTQAVARGAHGKMRVLRKMRLSAHPERVLQTISNQIDFITE